MTPSLFEANQTNWKRNHFHFDAYFKSVKWIPYHNELTIPFIVTSVIEMPLFKPIRIINE
ncbi:hypothetical protein AB3N60_11515 [Leptospira sp. WS39.C2]